MLQFCTITVNNFSTKFKLISNQKLHFSEHAVIYFKISNLVLHNDKCFSTATEYSIRKKKPYKITWFQFLANTNEEYQFFFGIF